MLRVRSFQGLIPAPGLGSAIAAVPYDVVNREEAAALAAGNPLSLLHVDRAEIDLPPEVSPYADAVYEKARAGFQALQTSGALIRETAPTIYVYRQRMGVHEQSGLAAVCHIDDYDQDLIKKHEKTRPDKENDRTRLIDTLSANTGPVFLTYRGTAELDALVAAAQITEPVGDFTAPDGVAHTVWRVADPAAVTAAFAQVPAAYVADGHHRTASAVRVGRARRAANPAHTGAEDYNWFLSVLFPAAQLRILPYNRLVADLCGRSAPEFLVQVSERFDVSPTTDPTPASPCEVSMFLGESWYRVAWENDPAADAISRLDVSVLQERLLAPLLGIEDPRTSQRIEFVGGIRGTNALVEAVQSGRGAVAFSMFPTTVAQLMEIADAGAIMPPKSTWFEPKLRSGLFIHTFA